MQAGCSGMVRQGEGLSEAVGGKLRSWDVLSPLLPVQVSKVLLS